MMLHEQEVCHCYFYVADATQYFKSYILTSDETKQLTSFRSQCVRGMRTHFKKMYPSTKCPLKCSNLSTYEDTPDRLLICSKLNVTPNTIKIYQIYASIVEQEKIAQRLSRLMRQNTTILEMQERTDLNNMNKVLNCKARTEETTCKYVHK